jgi:hypothetical protein
MNATKKLAAALLLFAAASAFTVIALIKEKSTSSSPSNSQNAAFVLYYGITCPHCKIVEEYLQKNDLPNKLDIVQKEVSGNSANANELVEKGKQCQLGKNELGAVPLLWDEKNSKCYVGDQPIIDFLKNRSGQIQ